MVDLSGQRLGNYRLLRLPGRGGFAEVYIADSDNQTGTTIGVSVMGFLCQ